MKNKKKYYYHHPESDSVWWSYLDPSRESNDGLVMDVSKKRAKELLKELGEDKIPDGNSTNN